MIDLVVETQPIPIKSDKMSKKHKMPEQESADSGIFTRSQSVKNELPNFDDENLMMMSATSGIHFEKALKPLVKKTSKDSGIDCRTKFDSIGSDAVLAEFKSATLIAKNEDEDDEQHVVEDKGGGQYSGSLPEHINKIKTGNNKKSVRSASSSGNSSGSNNNNNELSIENKNVPDHENDDECSGDSNKEVVVDQEECGAELEQHDYNVTQDMGPADDFYIDPRLINKCDGLKQSYFFTDENGSPKILEDLIEREVEKRSKKHLTSKSTNDDMDLFGCLGFSRFTRLFKNTRKYTLNKHGNRKKGKEF